MTDEEIWKTVVAIYADGGVIWDGSAGGSSIGGTWAWCAVDDRDRRVIEKSGFIQGSPTSRVTNNQTEQVALLYALEAAPDGWLGTAYSDSNNALGRQFRGWARNNLSEDISRRIDAVRKKLGYVEHVLLQGHPTKKDLACGIGKKRSLPVSVHNVWCDKACSRWTDEVLRIMGDAAPVKKGRKVRV